MRTFLVAVQMMTRVPVRLAEAPSERELGLAAAWFPLVGAAVGGVAAAAYWALGRVHLPSLAPWAALAATVVLTGAFHEDGLADTADGLFGGSDRARRLAIMRDSRVGSYGVVALVLVLGAQVTAVGALPAALGWRTLIAAHALGRAAALTLTRMPYARAEGGLGQSFAERVPAWALALALVTGLAPLALLPWPLALGAAGAAGLVALVAGWRFKRDLGGITGDTLGAAVKLAELTTYVRSGGVGGARMSSRLVLVTGGARSGKSRFAESRLDALAPGGPWRYVATAEALDDEMRARIAHHRARRGPAWHTVDASRALADAVRAPSKAAVLVDCVTIWLSNLMLDGASDEALLAAADEVAAAARAAAVPVVFVTNEVGAGIVPEHALARRFRDVAGWVNQRLAAASDEVFLVAAGLPLKLR